MSKKVTNFFSNHVVFNSFVHVIGGMGLGILITYPVIREHPVRWGLSLIILAVLGHLYASTTRK